MHESTDTLFRTGRTTHVWIEPRRPRSVVLLHHRVQTVSNPFPGATRNPLVLVCGSLAEYDLPSVASALLSLPGVVTPEVDALGAVDVPLIEPDKFTDEGMVWTITPDLTVLDFGLGDAILRVESDTNGPFAPVVNLADTDWWRLVRVLLSVDAWHLHLAEQSAQVASQLRAGLAEALGVSTALPIRIFHRIDGEAVVQVFSYDDTTSPDHPAALIWSAELFNSSGNATVGWPDQRTAHYRELGNRPLSPGDVVACGEIFYRYTAQGWERIPAPKIVEEKSWGTTPWSSGH